MRERATGLEPATSSLGSYYTIAAGIDVPGDQFPQAVSWAGFLSAVPRAVLTYAAFAAASVSLVAQRASRLRERAPASAEMRAARAKAQLDAARLQLLRSQLHPHFLFNALHAVGAPVAEDPSRARRMLAVLSRLLRQAVEVTEHPLIPLPREMEWLEQYVELQQMRYEHRLRVDLHLAPSAAGARVPPLVLQPLVENAIRFAVESRTEGGHIQVSASRRAGLLTLQVVDDGPGVAGAPASESTGMGLRLTRERLFAMFADAATLDLRNGDAGGTHAILTMPFVEDTVREGAS